MSEVQDKKDEQDSETPDIKNKKVKFDADQMVVVNGLYSEAWAKAKAKAEEEYKAKLDSEAAERKRIADEKAALEKQLEDLKKATKAEDKKEEKKEDPPKPQELNIEDHPAFKQLHAQFAEMKGIFTTVKQERDTFKAETEKAKVERKKARKKDQFLSAMKDANISFFDPLEAYELAERDGLDYDEDNDRVFAKNAATGTARLNENAEPMNAVDFVKDFASRKKYLVKAGQQDGGLGQGETEKLGKDKPAVKDWSKATPAELEAERQRIMTQRR